MQRQDPFRSFKHSAMILSKDPSVMRAASYQPASAWPVPSAFGWFASQHVAPGSPCLWMPNPGLSLLAFWHDLLFSEFNW